MYVKPEVLGKTTDFPRMPTSGQRASLKNVFASSERCYLPL